MKTFRDFVSFNRLGTCGQQRLFRFFFSIFFFSLGDPSMRLDVRMEAINVAYKIASEVSIEEQQGQKAPMLLYLSILTEKPKILMFAGV